ncbi:MAG: hypothetical protein HY906_11780 [Deltaproteobacteria bacterium]|nr:hypothetical protein [Deltaproteobacteria bacterium]
MTAGHGVVTALLGALVTMLLGATAPAGAAPVRQVAAGGWHSCARRADGRVVCWGAAYDGQLGSDGRGANRAPALVPGVGDAVQIAAGMTHTCARRGDGTVLCWGQPGPGQDAAVTTRPTLVAGLNDAVELAGGGTHFCARRRD